MLAVSIIVIFSLYATTALKTLPCEKDLLSVFYGNFVHIEFPHLMANLLALYALSRVEVTIGAKKFVTLVIFLLIFISLVQVVIHRIWKTVPCTIGFSGVLFGVAAWELVANQEVDLVLFFTIAAMVVLPSLTDKRVSLVGHTVGAVAGVAGGLLWKQFGGSLS